MNPKKIKSDSPWRDEWDRVGDDELESMKGR